MTANKGKVLLAAPVDNVLSVGLEAAGYELVEAKGITQKTAYELLNDCVGVITSTRLQLDKGLIDAAPRLLWVGRMGSGMEIIDLEYAKHKGISCYSSPEGNSNAVAEHVLGMLLALNKRIVWSNEEVKRGQWNRESNRGTELDGKTIGIIGFGHTGKAFAKKLQGFDVRILVFDKYKKESPNGNILHCADLSPIFANADIVSFHVPLQNDTIHYLNDSFITQMDKSFVVINTSRGIVVDTPALAEGIKLGKIRGACIDVWEEEPLEQMGERQRKIFEEMVQLPQVIITPHIAGYSSEALYKMSKILLDKIVTHR